jgi:hypothetical protein
MSASLPVRAVALLFCRSEKASIINFRFDSCMFSVFSSMVSSVDY